MKIKIISVGKIKEQYFTEGVKAYQKEMQKRVDCEIVEVPDEKTPDGAGSKAEIAVRDKEGQRILARIQDTDYVFALCIGGRQLTTSQLCTQIQDCRNQGVDSLVFVIGGSIGLSDEVIRRSDYKLSFSSMTFPHQMMRMILMEQLVKVV